MEILTPRDEPVFKLVAPQLREDEKVVEAAEAAEGEEEAAATEGGEEWLTLRQ